MPEDDVIDARSHTSRFFVTGGTLSPNDPSYVERAADRDLVAGLLAGEFCYVLDTRQMGKSSLIVRAAERLRSAGVTIGKVDLTALGATVTPLEWYSGFLSLLGETLNLSDETDDLWSAHASLGPAQRCFTSLFKAILGCTTGPVVIFVDEIDVTLGLPFAADDFFGGIRYLYNRRADDPEFNRIAFCLVGVASPSELIREPRLSPFNIGRRIVLSDFTPEESAVLAAGLPEPRLLERVLYWTSGHPYMTQRLCYAVAEQLASCTGRPQIFSAGTVDQCCSSLFLDQFARDADSSLAFVRSRLLSGYVDVAHLLDMYRQILRGKRVPYMESSAACVELILSGIVRVAEGRLVLRNRIFGQVFDVAWVRESLPGAELRRQSRAYRRGALRAGLISALAVALFARLAFTNARNASRAQSAEALAHSQADYAQARTVYADHLVYDINLIRARETYEADGLRMAEDQLKEMEPAHNEPDLRGFEWYYLRHICHNYLCDFVGHHTAVVAQAVSPDGARLASAETGHRILVWEIGTHRQVADVDTSERYGLLTSVVWSPDGSAIACGTSGGFVQFYSTATWRVIAQIPAHHKPVTSIAYSPDGHTFITSSNDGTARLWDVASYHEQRHVTVAAARGIWAVAVSPDNRILATGGDDGVARLWDIASGRPIRALRGHSWYVYALAFSPDGKRLVTGSGDTTAVLWEVATGRQIAVMRGHSSYLYTVAISPDDRLIVTGAWDRTARLWDAHTGAPVRALENTDAVWSAVFCRKGNAIAVGCSDGTERLWSVPDSPLCRELHGHAGSITSISFSANGSRFVTSSLDGTARIWDTMVARQIGVIATGHGAVTAALLIGNRCRTLSEADGVRDWNPDTGRAISTLLRPESQSIFRSILPDGQSVVQASQNGVITLRSVDGVSSAVPIESPDPNATCWFDRAESQVTYQSASRHIEISDARTGRVQVQSGSPVEIVNSAVFSPDGRLLVTSGAAGSMSIWNLKTAMILRTIAAHGAIIRNIAFSPDGQRIATASYDGSVKLWDTATWREVLHLTGHQGGATCLAFSPDGQQLVTGDAAGVVRIWDAPQTIPGI